MHFSCADARRDVARGGRKRLFVFWFEREVARRKKRRRRDGIVEFYFSPPPQRPCVNKYHSGAPPGSKRRLALRYRPSPDVNRQLVVSSWLGG